MDHTEFKRDVERTLAETPQAPPRPFSGRGIVTCAGGRQYFVNAYLNARLLRHLGCTLPIEWFHLGAAEMTPQMIEIAEEIPGVSCIDLSSEIQVHGDARKFNGGWQSKPLAILRSSFEEVLFVDADSFAIRDPSFLFTEPVYQDCGAVFWPDIHSWKPDRFAAREQLFEVPFESGPQLESGQIVVHKSRCWRAMTLTHTYNRHSDIVYQVVFGDKDTFYFAFRRTGTPFHIIQTPVRMGGGCMLQHDPQGQILFCHLTGSKWSMGGLSAVSRQDLPQRRVCRYFLRQLRRRWTRDRLGKADVTGRRRRRRREAAIANPVFLQRPD